MKNWLVLSLLALATSCSSTTTSSSDATTSTTTTTSTANDTGTTSETADDTAAETSVEAACEACVTASCSTEYATDCPDGKAGATACVYSGSQPNTNGAITCPDIIACLAADQSGCDYLQVPACSPGFDTGGQFYDVYNCIATNCTTACGF